MSEAPGLLWAYRIDGKGGAIRIGLDEATEPVGQDEFVWVHLDRTAPETETWLREQSGIEQLMCNALLAEETRPRCAPHGDDFLLNLRGVNLNPGADPEDMVSVRLWVERNRVISNRRLRLMAAQDMRDKIDAGDPPSSPGHLVVRLCEGLLERMEPYIVALSDRVDELEETVLTRRTEELREAMGKLRHQAVMLRRYIAPQRDAIGQLVRLKEDWFEEKGAHRLREAGNRITRFAEDLDTVRDRCAVIQDDLETRLNYQMNRTIYSLSVIAGIFLPLSFVAGLLGANVGGIPGEGKVWGFAAICAVLALIAAFEVWLFKRLKWM